MRKLAVLILTYNEELHISRCLSSLNGLDADLYVIDSFSNDKTVALAESFGATIVQNKFVNHAKQVNFAIDYLKSDYEWAFRIDADEVVDRAMVKAINNAVYEGKLCGFMVNRTMYFMGKRIRYGGMFPIPILRLFKLNVAHCQARWMDEHILVDGEIGLLDGNLFDNNLKSISWWIDKHNVYASKEAFEVLKTGGTDNEGPNSRLRRFYGKFPWSFRSLFYFFYRLVFRLGFLDGARGIIFHLLQGFWYRLLVDVKIHEVRRYCEMHKTSQIEAAKIVLDNVDFDETGSCE